MVVYNQQPGMVQQPVMMVQANPIEGHTCCGCFPIKCGLTTLGVFAILNTLGWLIITITFSSHWVYHQLLWITILNLLFQLVASILYCTWWCNDNDSTRSRLWIALLMNILVNVISLLSVIIYGGDPIYIIMMQGRPALDPTS